MGACSSLRDTSGEGLAANVGDGAAEICLGTDPDVVGPGTTLGAAPGPTLGTPPEAALAGGSRLTLLNW